MDFCLDAKHRLNDPLRIKVIRSEGERIKIFPFIVYRLNNFLSFPRLAIGITRRAGGSVVRNRFKRLVRELFRLNKHLLGFKDYYFFCSCDVTRLSQVEVAQLKSNILKRLSLCGLKS